MRVLLFGLLGLWLLMPWPAHAQDLGAAQGCRQVRINAKGSSGASITVSTSAVAVVDGNTSRCGLRILNETANGLRCAETTGDYTLTPTSTVGAFIAGNGSLVMGRAGEKAWSCIRTGASDAVVTVLEELP